MNDMKPGGFRLHIDIEIPEIKRPFPEISCTQQDALDTSKKKGKKYEQHSDSRIDNRRANRRKD